MSPQHLLLRVLLCIALILNGSGLAVAATQMHVQHAAMAGLTPDLPSDPTDGATCMEHSTSAASAAQAPLSGDHSAAADCCTGAACDVACPAGLLATFTAPAQGWRIAPQILAVRPALADHPAPALHNRYRPPIG
ncbi:CopL family metal-binding regulatory protein [Lysobacter sp. CW239]|uniref:CopL family metal-binding regulatory protein n=1 Tax=Novilysobacter ciconiae TaxID=2781022 RepID=A0A7S6ZR90_9GAMM|nr:MULTISPECIES: CopL family metal-binding regulatory protein [Lysobacter]QOD90001.1 CopL family metal-binding regulatory protein [Lysobacter sp. CW239]QOW18452.1 CopL family metal-binding regulatory protein [Lysobacter ciconiae]